MKKPFVKNGVGASITIIRPGDMYRDPEAKKDVMYEEWALRIDLIKNKTPMKFTKEQWNTILDLWDSPDLQVVVGDWK